MGTLLNVAQEDTGSSLLILRIMVKIVKRASYLVHPIEMRHGELADVIAWFHQCRRDWILSEIKRMRVHLRKSRIRIYKE